MKRAGYKCYSAGDSDGRGIGKRMGNVHYLGASQLALSAINTQSAAGPVSWRDHRIWHFLCLFRRVSAQRTTESNAVHFDEAHYCQPTVTAGVPP